MWAKHILWQDSVANLSTSKNKYFFSWYIHELMRNWNHHKVDGPFNLFVLFFQAKFISKEDYVSNSQQQGYADRQGNPNIEINHFSQPKPSARQTEVKGPRGVFAQKTLGKSQQSHLQGSRRFSVRRNSHWQWAGKKTLEDWRKLCSCGIFLTMEEMYNES